MQATHLAKAMATKGEHKQYFVGACIVKANRVLGMGCNKNKTHPMMGHVRHLHAEIDAILHIKDKRSLENAEIYVVRLNKNGKVGMAKPCSICTKHLIELGFKGAYYTNSDGIVLYTQFQNLEPARPE